MRFPRMLSTRSADREQPFHAIMSARSEDGLGEGRIADDLAPLFDRNLARDNRRGALMASSKISSRSRSSDFLSADRPLSSLTLPRATIFVPYLRDLCFAEDVLLRAKLS